MTLIVLGGLPGAGKSTIARLLAARLEAVWLRIDSIEQALRHAGVLADDLGPAGYLAAYAVARDNLRLGRTVIADSVNPIAVTRRDWRAVAGDGSLLEVEVICSDPTEHRRRVENRAVDVAGLTPPTWTEVIERDYEPWPQAMAVDTAKLTAEAAVETILLRL